MLRARSRQAIKRLIPPRTRAWLRAKVTAHTHVVITAEGGTGFALIGDKENSNPLAAAYLGKHGALAERWSLHGSDFSDAALRLAKKYGLVRITGLPIPARLANCVIRVPRFVALSINDIGTSEKAFISSLPKSARSDLSHIRRESFEMEIEKRLGWADEFFSLYHQEAITRRHGADGFVMPLQEIRDYFKSRDCEFLCVTQQGKRLAALLGEATQDGYYMARLGWLDGDPELVRRGVLAGLYWFAIRRARDLGMTRVRMGGTPPFLEDGVLRFKMKWNAELDLADTRFGFDHLLIDTGHPAARAFLSSRSVIALDAAGRFVVYSGRPMAEVNLSDALAKGISKWMLAAPEESLSGPVKGPGTTGGWKIDSASQ